MDFLASPLGVIAILSVVVIAAFVYKPAKYVAAWRDVAERYETTRRPMSVTFRGEDISLGRFEMARVDAALNDDGFWMLYDGPETKKAPNCTLIPWDCLRFKEALENRHNFQIRTKKIVELFVSPELGTALQRRTEKMPVEPQL
jgi:hypothetical protein